LSDASYLNLQIVILFGEVTKAENIKANLQRRIKPTAGGAKKRLKKIEKIKFFFFSKNFSFKNQSLPNLPALFCS
jgi:hypothetical protein